MAVKGRRTPETRGEAGRTGGETRSDLHVAIEPRAEGGIGIELVSRVEPYYGDSIRSQVTGTIRALGVEAVTARIDDRGALPFVIAARVEAAIRRAGAGDARDGRPERTVSPPPGSARDRLRRSRLYLPGDEPKFMINAGLHGPDGIILDLEDSVHPDAKDQARLLVRNALRCVDFGASERMVRVNTLPVGLEDLEAVVPEMPDMILLPKVEDPAQVERASRAIDEILAGTGESRAIWLMPILETALGIERAFEIAGASNRVAALTIGLEDYTADLGVVKTAAGEETLFARMRVVNAARAAGVQPIDSVYGDVEDLDGMRSWAGRSRALGFEGMGCIHPRQIAVVHEAFSPSAREIEKAEAIVAAFEEAQARGLGVVSLGSKMIDPPVVERARKLVARARRSGKESG
jgi:citrate lyase subunit beta/citryl-CoA lyase